MPTYEVSVWEGDALVAKVGKVSSMERDTMKIVLQRDLLRDIDHRECNQVYSELHPIVVKMLDQEHDAWFADFVKFLIDLRAICFFNPSALVCVD